MTAVSAEAIAVVGMACTAGLARRLAGEYGGITTLAATGDHWSMLLPPHVHTLARDIRSVLAEVHNG